MHKKQSERGRSKKSRREERIRDKIPTSELSLKTIIWQIK
jgi:hypothetical protein